MSSKATAFYPQKYLGLYNIMYLHYKIYTKLICREKKGLSPHFEASKMKDRMYVRICGRIMWPLRQHL